MYKIFIAAVVIAAGFIPSVSYPEDHMGIVILTNEEDRSAPERIEKLINQVAVTVKAGAPSLP